MNQLSKHVLVLLMVLCTATAPAAAIPISVDEPTAENDTVSAADWIDNNQTVTNLETSEESTNISTEGPNTTVHNVTLISGQTVTVVDSNGSRRYQTSTDEPMQKVRVESGTLVFPANTDFEKFDRSLFNVDFLIDQGYTDAETAKLPVIVTRAEQSKRITPGEVSTDSTALAMASGAELTSTLPSINGEAGFVRRNQAGTAYDQLRSDDTVNQVSLDVKYTISMDEVGSIVDAERARQNFNVSGAGTQVAVIDSGIDEDHPDLKGSIVASKDFTGNGGTEDLIGHGTHVAGILAGDGSASSGTYRGVAPNASLLDARVFYEGGAKTSTIIAAMNWSVSQDADIISMSLGGRSDRLRSNDPYHDAVRHAIENNVTVVTSAGNNGVYGSVGSPGTIEGAITVGSSDKTGNISDFSSRGPTPVGYYLKPDLVAPGSQVTSAASADAGFEEPYRTISGTSMSAPVVSGVAALVLEENPDWEPSRVKNTLVSSADPLGGPDVYSQGAGRVNASAALSSDVVITPGTTDFGLQTGNTAVNRTVTVTNHGSSNKTLSLDATVRSIDSNTATPVSLNKSSVTLGPNESATVAVEVDTGVDAGVYSGRLSVNGGEHTAIFGFVKGEEITITKHALDNTKVSDDYVIVYPQQRGNLGNFEFAQFDNGTATVTILSEGMYNVDTSGFVEDTMQPVIMTKEVSLPSNGNITLDEANTAVIDLERQPLQNRSGSLQNRALSVTYTKSVAGGTASGTSSTNYLSTDAVRVLPDENLNVSIQRVLVPMSEQSQRDSLDASSLYHLSHSLSGVSGPETLRVNVSALGIKEMRYYRSTPSQTYEAVVKGAGNGNDITVQGSIEDRQRQDIYVSPSLESHSVGATIPYNLWTVTAERSAPLPDAGQSVYRSVNKHPFQTFVRQYFQNDTLTLEADTMRTQGFPSGAYNDTAPDSMAVYVNGSLAYSETAATSSFRTAIDVPIDSTYSIYLEANNEQQSLSTRIVTGKVSKHRESGDSTPPNIGYFGFRTKSLNGSTPNGNITTDVFTYEPEDGENVSSVRVLVANTSVATTPFDADGSVAHNGGWTELSEVQSNTSLSQFTGNIGNETGTFHIAIRAENDAGGVTHTTVFNATRVGDVPPRPSLSVNRSLNGSRILTDLDTTVRFDGSNSTDNLGISSYDWEIDGASYTGPRANHTFTSLGMHSVSLTVTDTGGLTNTVNWTVEVVDRIAPVPVLVVSRTTADVNRTTVELNASDSTDNHQIAAYRWDLDGDGKFDRKTKDEVLSTTLSRLGTYNVTVQAVDKSGNVATAAPTSITVDDKTTPTVVATANKSTVNVSSPIAFDGSETTDNGPLSELDYEWSFDDGTTKTGTAPVYRFDATGMYNVTLNVSDSGDNTATKSIKIEAVDRITPTPTLAANTTTPSVNVTTVEFDASGSTDNVGITEYHWDVDGDGTVDETTKSPQLTYVYSTMGDYDTTVTAVDDAGNSATTSLGISVTDQTAPDAVLRANQTTIALNETVGLNGSASTDNHAITSYEWRFPDRSAVTGMTTTANWSTPGDREVELNVTDDAGNIGTDKLTISVKDNTPPTAALTVNRTTAEVGLDDIRFDATNASDNHEIAAYRWDINGDGIAEYETVDPVLAASVYETGNVSVSVTVVDQSNNTATATTAITSNDTTAPTATLVASKTTITEGDSVTFDATSSTDNHVIQSYQWDFTNDNNIDRMTTSGSVTRTFESSGTYTVNVSVRDQSGNRDSKTVTITVETADDGGGGGGGGSGGGGGGSTQTETTTPTTTSSTPTTTETTSTTTTTETTTVTTTETTTMETTSTTLITETTSTESTSMATTTETTSGTSATQTPTTTKTTTQSTATSKETTEDGGSPGFGVLIALIALLMAAMVLTRREE